MKKSFCLLLTCLFLVGLWSCSKDDNPGPPSTKVAFKATLNGAQETPPNASTATGEANGTYDTKTKVLTLTITYTGITPTVGHIHIGPVGVKGDIVFPLAPPLDSPIYFTSPALDDSQETI